MFRSLLAWLSFGDGNSSGRGGDTASGDSGDGDDSDDGGFRPSRLDASVLSAHGADVEHVMADIEQQAQELEAAREEWE